MSRSAKPEGAVSGRSMKPNLLLIMADQLSASALPFYGNGVVDAVNLSRLAEEGVVFDKAYCPSPLCAPSRFAMMTGRLPSRIGAYDNAAHFSADMPTFAHHLRNAGYRTALSGKMHFVGPDQLHGFEERLTTDIYPADFAWTPNWADANAIADWSYAMPAFMEAGPCIRSNQIDYDEEAVFAARRWLYDRARARDDQPFALTVSLSHPHDPYFIGEEYWNRHDLDEIDLPKCPDNPLADDPHWHRLRTLNIGIRPEHVVTDEIVRRARRAYYGAVEFVDEQVGHILKTLRECGFGDNTVIVFTADHGDMLGERGLWDKSTFYENAARVPLLVHAPERFKPGRVRNVVSTLGLLPTFLELATDAPADILTGDIDGRSLLPQLNGGEGQDEAIGEYLGEGTHWPLLMIRRGDFKYVRCQGDPEQLFDLSNDPLETRNLAAEDPHIEVLRAFRVEAKQRWNEEALRDEIIDSQKRRRVIDRALATGRHHSWDFQPFVDASATYIRERGTLDVSETQRRLLGKHA